MLKNPVLVVIDMQKDFCMPGFKFDDGNTDFSDIQQKVEKTGKFLEEYRAKGHTPIIFKTVHGPQVDSEPWKQKYKGEPPCLKGSEGAELMPDLGIDRENDIVITKNRFDAFHKTELDERLEKAGVTQVALAGVMTNVCVEYTAQSAFNHGYHVQILEDLTGSVYPGKREEALEKMSNIYASVKGSEKLLQ